MFPFYSFKWMIRITFYRSLYEIIEFKNKYLQYKNLMHFASKLQYDTTRSVTSIY